MTLKFKIALGLALLLLFIAGASSLYIQLRLSGQLRSELQKRGVTIARHLAGSSTGNLLAQDRLALKMLALATMKDDSDIAYIFFLGPDGADLLAHTFGETFPFALIGANPLPAGEPYSLRNLETKTGPIYDVAVPVEGGGLGLVRVGLSSLPISTAVGQLSGELLFVILLIGIITLLLCLPVSAQLTGPIEDLTDAVKAAAGGDFTQRVASSARDEIGQLATSFNAMLAKLQAARQELLERNTDLAEEVEHRRQVEDQLAAQLNLISLLMNKIPTPLFFKDTSGQYSGCNRAFEELIEAPREELIGKTIFDFVPESEAAVHTQADQALFSNPGACRYELSFTTRSGKKHQFVVQKATYNKPNGAVAGMVGVLIDVTQEREIDRLRNDFVSTAAHEFQTPLTAILGFCELLQSNLDLSPAERQEYLGIIQERGEFLSRLVDRFLDVSRIDAGRALPLDRNLCQPDRLLHNLMHNYTKQHDSHHFLLQLPPANPALDIDEVRFVQVIENLLSNAVKYSPAGSRIRISASLSTHHYHIDVQDEGPGLTPVQLNRLFDKFYRVDSSNHAPSGTGLGLYLCKAIVAAHGGEIIASSKVGCGTTFRVSIPLPSGHRQ